MIELRAHHGMCLFYFNGKGYSNEFTEHMAGLKVMLNRDDPMVRIVTHTDCVCGPCPNNHSGICSSQEKVTEYDKAVLDCCGLPDPCEMHFHEFQAMVIHKIIQPRKRTKICGDCQWNKLCME